MTPMVVIPASQNRVRVDKVHSIVSNRIRNNEEEYLVRWETKDSTRKPPLSWHSLRGLDRCLESIQDYLEIRERELIAPAGYGGHAFKKRKSPDTDVDLGRRPSPFERLQLESRASSASRSSSPASVDASSSPEAYNGVFASENGFLFAKSQIGPGIQEIDIKDVPTLAMREAARRGTVDRALQKIRNEYVRRLNMLKGPKIHLFNIQDLTTPSLRFRYIDDYVLREGVYRLDPGAQEGCKSCSPSMGRNIGCEYTRKCECLEYAAVDETRLTPAQQHQYNIYLTERGSTMGLPKKFPYFVDTKIQRSMTLVPFYLNSRRPIYECNDNCNCGPACRNKNVQFGRTVEVEIFKTKDGRGWGLTCKQDLHKGQFIDTYRGEIITDAEATRREQSGTKAKASYLYSLDKFAEEEGFPDEEIFVVDGEFMGGPTKFINHSCEPNCRQYTVSYNRHDARVYDIALFACEDIPAGTELTFDYLDKEDDEPIEKPGEGAIPCRCGKTKCRKWLWT